MDHEAALLSMVVIEKRYTEIIDLGVRDELFVGAKAEWEYLGEFHRAHGATPPPEQFEKMFPNFELELVDAPSSFLVEMLQQRFVHNGLTEGLQSAAKLLKNKDPLAAKEVLQQQLLRIDAVASLSQDVDLTVNPEARVGVYRDLVAAGGITGYRTPWPVLDEVTLGFHPQELIMLVASSGVGKSWCEVILALHSWSLGHIPLLFTNEMSVEQIIRRADATNAQLPYQRFRAGELTQDEFERWEASLAEMQKGNVPFWVSGDDDGARGISGVEAKILRYKPNIVFIDGVALMADEQGAGSGWERLHNLSRGLKKISRRQNVPIIVSHWFSKDGKGDGGTADDLKFGDVQNHYDLMIGMYQSEDARSQKEMLFRILKQREGERLEFVANWDLDKMHFTEKALEVEDDGEKDTVSF